MEDQTCHVDVRSPLACDATYATFGLEPKVWMTQVVA